VGKKKINCIDSNVVGLVLFYFILFYFILFYFISSCTTAKPRAEYVAEGGETAEAF